MFKVILMNFSIKHHLNSIVFLVKFNIISSKSIFDQIIPSNHLIRYFLCLIFIEVHYFILIISIKRFYYCFLSFKFRLTMFKVFLMNFSIILHLHSIVFLVKFNITSSKYIYNQNLS